MKKRERGREKEKNMEKESSRYNFLLRNVIASWKTHEDDLKNFV